MGQLRSPDHPTSPDILGVFTRLGTLRSHSIGCLLNTLPSGLRRATATRTCRTGRAEVGSRLRAATLRQLQTTEWWAQGPVTSARMARRLQFPISALQGLVSPWTTQVVQSRLLAPRNTTHPPALAGLLGSLICIEGRQLTPSPSWSSSSPWFTPEELGA
jgi:hypothetical protein